MTTRQELYDRIRSSSRDEVILEEMIRLGFWPRTGEMPADPADEIRRCADLAREIRALGSENRRLQNVDALKRAMRKKRMEESRRKQTETKERRLRERQERAVAWKRRKETEIVYLGKGVSAGLANQDLDEAKLSSLGLPTLATAQAMAEAMGVTVGALRFLSYGRRTSQVSHYRRFAIKKKTGGQRRISAPMPRLKRLQHWILENILERVPLNQAAHGFRRGRSIVTNAQAHAGCDLVINVDLQDFFPTVTYPRIKGVFRSLGYSEATATILALICSEPETVEAGLDGQTYYVARGPRFLPQGAPTSPAITNVICRGLDARLTRVAEQLGFRYTRYADDMSFSAGADAYGNIGAMLRRLKYIVQQEGFQVHPKKARVQRRGSRREVTGLTVNDRVSIPRALLRRFRAVLFQIEKDGPAGKRWGNKPDVIAAIEGFANFVRMVEPERGEQLMRRVEAIIERHGRGPRPEHPRRRWSEPGVAPTGVVQGAQPPSSAAPESPSDPTAARSAGEPSTNDPKKPWWKFW